MNPTPPRLGRRVVASAWAAIVLPYVVLSLWVPLARSMDMFALIPMPTLVAVSALAGALLMLAVPRLSSPLPASLDDWLDPERRKLALLWAIGGLLAALLLGRIAVYLADPSLVAFSIAPDEPFLVRHSCLTAYMHGAILSMLPGTNVYDMAFVESSADAGVPLPASAEHFAPFTLDAYGYPPPFLLLPRALLLLTNDFYVQRLLFGSASLLLFAFACVAAAKTLGGVAERRIWLLGPLFIANPYVVVILQVGNFHLAAVAICLLCWVALQRRRDGLAGTLLAIATLSKIFPGLLGVLLLMQRRWRAVGFTCLAALVLCGLSVAVLGVQVWRDFLFYHLPHVQSGEALLFLAGSLREIAFNIAPFGIPFKLDALGLEGWGWEQARMIGNVYTLLLFALAVLAARRPGDAQQQASRWMAIVMLASLRSPYAAPFVMCAMSLVYLLIAAEVRSWRSTLAFVTLVLVLSSPFGEGELVASMLRMGLLYGVCGWLALRRPSG